MPLQCKNWKMLPRLRHASPFSTVRSVANRELYQDEVLASVPCRCDDKSVFVRRSCTVRGRSSHTLMAADLVVSPELPVGCSALRWPSSLAIERTATGVLSLTCEGAR